ncbi:hypothetical protein IWQ62_002980 [Dispira parvispora]|uniref:Methylmalonyl Co-A mutase-associated GTPase MeaB n=1 Tax=Dispira parvispora TaxID=1520584 RepID=A0A9W8AVN6_9FUNG|nr:hypothetical protein IWQ62_002980 [Dispira parvispora]
MSTQVDVLYKGLRQGQRTALSRAITLDQLLQRLLDDKYSATAPQDVKDATPPPNSCFRIGLSGPPGVGKSTFIEAFGLHLIEMGHRVAVLAVDPSSVITGGSILGDKTRMPYLTRNPNAYIRPSPNRGTLGGVAKNTHKSMLLCEAAGFDICLVETVGVGQSETTVADMVDMFILLVSPGGGDELQGMKKGIMEIADMVVVTKADGDLANAARRAQMEYTSATKFMHPRIGSWKPPVLPVSSVTGEGLPKIWSTMSEFQHKFEVSYLLQQRLSEDQTVRDTSRHLEQQVYQGSLTPGIAAQTILQALLMSWHREVNLNNE